MIAGVAALGSKLEKAPLEVHKDTRLGVLGLLLVKAARSQDLITAYKHNRRNHDLPVGSFRNLIRDKGHALPHVRLPYRAAYPGG